MSMTPGLVLRLSGRYLRGRGSANAVPILSRIAMGALAVGAGALIVLLSVFNGFESLIHDFYKAFYPDVRITAARGKTFVLPPQKLQQLKGLKGVRELTNTLEDAVLVGSQTDQFVVTLKGIEPSYYRVNTIQDYTVRGRDTVADGPLPTAMMGLTIAARLEVNPDNPFTQLLLYYPDAQARGALDAASAVRTLELKPDGVFQVEQESDARFILAPIGAVRGLLGAEGESVSSVELAVAPGSEKSVQKAAKAVLGAGFKVETRYEQNRSLYAVMRAEKWAVYAILVLVLLIASANLVSALSMLVLEKGRDIGMLRAMGATAGGMRAVFLVEGALWAGIGGGIGLAAGAAICWGQQKFEWIKLQGSFLISAYPVQMQAADFVLVFFTVVLLGMLAAARPAWVAGQRRLFR